MASIGLHRRGLCSSMAARQPAPLALCPLRHAAAVRVRPMTFGVAIRSCKDAVRTHAAAVAEAPSKPAKEAPCPPTLYLFHWHDKRCSSSMAEGGNTAALMQLRDDVKAMEKVAKKAAWFSSVDAEDGQHVLLVTDERKLAKKYGLMQLPAEATYTLGLQGKDVGIPVADITAAVMAERAMDSDSESESDDDMMPMAAGGAGGAGLEATRESAKLVVCSIKTEAAQDRKKDKAKKEEKKEKKKEKKEEKEMGMKEGAAAAMPGESDSESEDEDDSASSGSGDEAPMGGAAAAMQPQGAMKKDDASDDDSEASSEDSSESESEDEAGMGKEGEEKMAAAVEGGAAPAGMSQAMPKEDGSSDEDDSSSESGSGSESGSEDEQAMSPPPPAATTKA